MSKTEFTTQPEKIKYEQITKDKAFVQLRKNITQETRSQDNGDGKSTEVTLWTADEKQFFTTLSFEEVESQFDMLFLTAGALKPTNKERLSALEDAVSALM